MRVVLCLFVLLASTLTASVVNAGEYNFTLHNNAGEYTINGFYTYQKGQWSANWLQGQQLAPGQSVPMEWNSDQGACVVPFSVHWVGWGHENHSIDWCQNDVINLYMENKGYTWD